MAAAEALMEEAHPAQISAEAIAARAGVSKATLYKWWPSKSHILMDVVLARANAEIVLPNTGSARTDFTETLRAFIHFHTQTRFGHAVAHLFAEGLNDPALNLIYRDHYALPRRRAIMEIWRRGVARGELRPDIDPELALDFLYGGLLYRFFLNHAPIDPGLAERIVALACDGVAFGE